MVHGRQAPSEGPVGTSVTSPEHRRPGGLLGRVNVTADIDPCLVETIGCFFGEDFRDTRFFQVVPEGLLYRWLRLFCGNALAVTWVRDVYIMPGGVDYSDYAETCTPWHTDTIAHELYHVAQFRRARLVQWVLDWLRDLRKYGRDHMYERPVEVEAESAAANFRASPEYAWLRCERGCEE